jgi:UDP-N-acetylmuramate dehydrogenase
MNYSKIKKIIDSTNIKKAMYGCDTSRLCSIRAGGRAAALVTAGTGEELISLLKALERENTRYLILGGGTNILFTRDLPDLVLIKLGRPLGNIDIDNEGRIEAGAAAPTAVLVNKAAAAGKDLTFLAGIPGTVGGAIAGNSGSTEKWICQSITRLRYIRRGKSGLEPAQCKGEEVNCAYRFFDIPGLVAVISAIIIPENGDPSILASKIRENMSARKSSQPVGTRTSGCFFKNPGNSKKSAGALIEECGLKGFMYGGARISPVHANFIENFRSASPHDIVVLSRIIKDKVQEKFGVSLEYEVKMIG